MFQNVLLKVLFCFKDDEQADDQMEQDDDAQMQVVLHEVKALLAMRKYTHTVLSLFWAFLMPGDMLLISSNFVT